MNFKRRIIFTEEKSVWNVLGIVDVLYELKCIDLSRPKKAKCIEWLSCIAIWSIIHIMNVPVTYNAEHSKWDIMDSLGMKFIFDYHPFAGWKICFVCVYLICLFEFFFQKKVNFALSLYRTKSRTWWAFGGSK